MDMTIPKLPENPIHETNRRLNRMLNVLEQMQGMEVEAARMLQSLNDAGSRMMVDLATNSKKTERFAKLSIALAVLALMVAAYGVFQDGANSKTQAALNEKLQTLSGTQEKLNQTIEQLSSAISKLNQKPVAVPKPSKSSR
jgi:hypothetical protein